MIYSNRGHESHYSYGAYEGKSAENKIDQGEEVKAIGLKLMYFI